MALKSTIYKADLQVSNLNENKFGDFSLTIARHPSETDERMMVRILAFALHAHSSLSFGKGLSTEDEPDLWLKDLTGEVKLWIDVGQPDERRILKACGRSDEVCVYSYSGTNGVWWRQVGLKVQKARNLKVFSLPAVASLGLAKLAQRSMKLQCTIQDEQIWFSSAEQTVQVELTGLNVHGGS